MTDSTGCGFVCSKAGFWKLLVIIFGAACWGIYISSGSFAAPPIKTYIMIAFIISTGVSLVTYFMRITGLDLMLQSQCMPFSTFDYFWSWISSLNYLASSVIMGCYFGNGDPFCNGNGSFCKRAQELTALLLGLFTAVLYTLEAQNLKRYAPVGAGYGTTWRGMWKVLILAVGAVAFGFLIRHRRCRRSPGGNGCNIARTFTLVAWCIAWSVTALIYILRIISCHTKLSTTRQTVFGAFEFFWSAFSCLLYLIGSAVFAGFMQCSASDFRSPRENCRWMLAILVSGFATAVLFAIDAIYLRDQRPVWLVRRRVRRTRDGEVVTTETRRATNH